MKTSFNIYTIIRSLVIVALIFALLVVILVFAKMVAKEIQGDTVVLAFFGILATIIVIGNYAQVSYLTGTTRAELNDMQKDLGSKPTKEQVMSDILKHPNFKKLFAMESKMKDWKIFFLRISTHKLGDFIASLLTSGSIHCSVNVDGHKIEATAIINESNKVEFHRRDNNKLLSNITKVGACTYNENEINNIIKSYHELDAKSAIDLIYTGV